MEKEIKAILVDGQGWFYAERQVDNDPSVPSGTYRIERNPITEFQVNGEMALVRWFKQGNREFNGKYVLIVERYD